VLVGRCGVTLHVQVLVFCHDDSNQNSAQIHDFIFCEVITCDHYLGS
jgi:hypothetical protein